MKKMKRIGKNSILLDGKLYKGYMLGDLPPTFSFLFKEDIKWNEEKEDYEKIKIYGISKWFNYKGLTWIWS